MQQDDFQEILLLDHQIFTAPDDGYYSYNDFQRYYEKGYSFVSYDETTAKINGYIFASTKINNSLFIGNFAVDPNYRRRNIGYQLIQAVFNAGQHSAKNQIIQLQVKASEITAINLYKKFGFVESQHSPKATRFNMTAALTPNPLRLNEINLAELAQVKRFKIIYNALYAGQSSFFKSPKATITQLSNLSINDIRAYIRKNPDSRTKVAWDLAQSTILDKRELFMSIHNYCYNHSSSFFIFKQSNNFPESYENVEERMMAASSNSRTGKIRDALEFNSGFKV